MFNSTTVAPSSSTTPSAGALAAILQADPVSCEILRFLLENESAMDSAKGIAAWWVHRDELAVQPSLHRLFACGAILVHTLSSGSTLYGLTQDTEVRAWLRNAFGVPDDQRASADRQPRQKKTAMDVQST
jgi:hypothetical protein